MDWFVYVWAAFIIAICIATLVYVGISIAAAVKRLHIEKDLQKIVEKMKNEESGDDDGDSEQN
jgi:cell division protein FtsL